jgi:hypothetical protein
MAFAQIGLSTIFPSKVIAAPPALLAAFTTRAAHSR